MVRNLLKTRPNFEYEQALWDNGLTNIAGVDEVGRGCFAGPVVAAAVIFPQGFTNIERIDDSKRLSAKVREDLARRIKKYALSYSIAEVSVGTINSIGIGKAAQQAFIKAVSKLHIRPQHILMDAFFITDIDRSVQTPVIKGDQKSISIAAASIIAKVHRDRLMQELPARYALYDFMTNKGYGTKKHREAIGQYGFCDLHRTSFNLTKFLPRTST